MTHETPPNDPRLIWKSQGREHPITSVEEVRLKAQIVQAKVRRNLIFAFALALLLLVFCTIAIVAIPSTRLRVITAAMIVLTVAVAYKGYYRLWSPRSLSTDAAVKGCLNFYRRELEAQYRSAALTWRFLVPFVMFVFLTWNVIVRTNSLLPRMLLPSVLVLILFVRRHGVRQLQRKLAALDEFEKENS